MYVYKVTKEKWRGIPHGRVMAQPLTLPSALPTGLERCGGQLSLVQLIFGNVDMTWQPRKCIYICGSSGHKASWAQNMWCSMWEILAIYERLSLRSYGFSLQIQRAETQPWLSSLLETNPNPNCPETEQLTTSLNAVPRLFSVTFLICISQPSLLC